MYFTQVCNYDETIFSMSSLVHNILQLDQLLTFSKEYILQLDQLVQLVVCHLIFNVLLSVCGINSSF